MGYEGNSYYQPGPCAMCDKPGGGWMGSSKWEHDAMCCSDTCGFAYKNSPKRAMRELERIDWQMSMLREERKNWKQLAEPQPDKP